MWSRILIPVLLLAASPSFANPAPEIRKALVWDSEGSVSVQPYELLEDGRAVFQGDMILPLDEDGNVRLFLERPKSTGFRGLLWNDAILYYEIDPALGGLISEVEASISEWQAQTGMRLVPRTNERDYILFTTESRNACFSYYGRRGGRQTITLHPNCTKSAILHEIGHAAGLFHEQSRTDRDDYVNLHLENADPAYWYAFDIFSPAQGYNYGPYDHSSIMHYPSYSFSTNEQPTITKKDGSLILRNRVLSPGDLAGIRALYGLADPNLLQNPGFESGKLSPWVKGPGKGPGVVAVEKCCNKTPGGKWNGVIKSRGQSVEMIQKVGVTPGRTYRLSATVSTKGLTANLKWYSNVTGDRVCASTRVRWPSVEQLTCEFTVPAGTTKFNVGLSVSGPAGKSALSDDWSLTDITGL